MNITPAGVFLKSFFPNGVKLFAYYRDNKILEKRTLKIFDIPIDIQDVKFKILILGSKKEYCITLKKIEDFLNGYDIDTEK